MSYVFSYAPGGMVTLCANVLRTEKVIGLWTGLTPVSVPASLMVRVPFFHNTQALDFAIKLCKYLNNA